MIAAIDQSEMLIGECRLPGESKREHFFPAHPSGLQLSANRWMILYATRGVRQFDDDHSIVYQVRADSPVGPVLHEDFLNQASTDWAPFGDGSAYVCLLRHPMGFGTPKGARINGRPAEAANVFAVQWTRSAAGRLDPATGLYRYDAALEYRTLEGVWCQFRLNDSGDDIEILQPPQKLRQQGYENGPAFCRHESARAMITSLAPPAPWNSAATEWAVTQNLGIGCAAIKYRFNPQAGRYEWVETGPACRGNDEFALSEPVLAKASDSWIVGIRVRQHLPHVSPDWAGGRHKDRGHTGWIRVADPFRELPFPRIVQDPNRQAPMTVFRCADGVLRLFSGDFANSPYRQRRDPLYCWDVDPVDFRVTRQQVVFDSVRAGVFSNDPRLPRSTCFASVIPHGGGNTQYVVHRVMCFRYLAGVEKDAPPITSEQLANAGIYCARIRYTEDQPSAWQF